MPRREFVKLGAVGAAALAVPMAGGPIAGAARRTGSVASLCGDPKDKGPELWDRASKCGKAHHSQKPPDPALGCRGTTDDYVVFNGGGIPQNYLTVPTSRRKGIECPRIWAASAPNYWAAAWAEAQPGGAGPVAGPIGLGINSAKDRRQDQLHIHMATMLSGLQAQLQALEKSGAIATSLAKWDTSVVEVTALERHGGQLVPDKRAYRAVRLPNLSRNLFTLVNRNVASARQDMSLQMLAATSRLDPQTQKPSGFYVLNSDPKLKGLTHGVGGTGACDQLFTYN